MVFRYEEKGGLSSAQDVTGVIWTGLLQGISIISVKVDFLPVFKPNEYFWKHHWREGKEEKWEAYARAVR